MSGEDVATTSTPTKIMLATVVPSLSALIIILGMIALTSVIVLYRKLRTKPSAPGVCNLPKNPYFIMNPVEELNPVSPHLNVQSCRTGSEMNPMNPDAVIIDSACDVISPAPQNTSEMSPAEELKTMDNFEINPNIAYAYNVIKSLRT